MARRKKDAKVDTRAAREGLPIRREPHWTYLTAGLALGYRKGKKGGHWVAKHYSAEHGKRYISIGHADDVEDVKDTDAGIFTFDQAQKKARAWLAAADRKGDAPHGPYTVSKSLDDYLDFLRSEGRSEAAISGAKYSIEAFIRPKLGGFDVADLTAKQLRRWHADLSKNAPRARTKKTVKQQYREPADERARKATANRILTTLKASLNHAFDEELVSSNKAWGRKVKPFKNVETARKRWLQIADAKRLLNSCDATFRPIVEGALQTGARYSELARLKVDDFDSDNATVFIQMSKSGKARHLVLSDEGVQFFSRTCAGRALDELIFRKGDGGPWLKSHQARPMADACKRAKIIPSIGFHALRHTWASLLVKSGAPLHAIAKNLGHFSKDGQPDVRMVTRHYAHFEKSFEADMIRKHSPSFGFSDENVVALAS